MMLMAECYYAIDGAVILNATPALADHEAVGPEAFCWAFMGDATQCKDKINQIPPTV